MNILIVCGGFDSRRQAVGLAQAVGSVVQQRLEIMDDDGEKRRGYCQSGDCLGEENANCRRITNLKPEYIWKVCMHLRKV